MASWPVKLLAVVISSGLALTALELGVRKLAPQPLSNPKAPALLRGRLTQPGDHTLKTAEYDVQIHVNKQGFVDNEWAPRQQEIPRIVVIGDSFVQAAQVALPKGFGRVLANRVSQRMGKEVEVLSLGVPGAGTGTALGLLDNHALKLKPDAIVLGFLVANDVMNNHPLLEGKTDKPFFRLVDGHLMPSNREDYGTRSWQGTFLWENSEFWRWGIRKSLIRQETTRQLQAGQGIPLALRVHDPDANPAWEEAWEVTDALIQAVASRCKTAHIPFGILLFPDAIQATTSGHDQMQKKWPSTATWDVSAATKRAHKMASRHAPVQDLRPALAEADAMGSESTYFLKDGHWTPLGHATAAQGAVDLVVKLLESP